jgi:arylsulfatase A-like enzyme
MRKILIAFLAQLVFNFSLLGNETVPNIILIVADDLGYHDVGFNGAIDIPTPNIDEIAKNGIIFNQAYVVHPYCGPSRMGILSGRYPFNFGGQMNLPFYGNGSELGIPTNEFLLSNLLQKSGYETTCIGKWHMGKNTAFRPHNRGFNNFFGFYGGGHFYFPDQYEEVYEKLLDRGVEEIGAYYLPIKRNDENFDENEYLTDAFTRETISAIHKSAETPNPFFIYLAYNAPHSPLEAKEDDLNHPQIDTIQNTIRKTYAAMVHAMDRGIGNIINALNDTDQLENTLIVFLSDNGGLPALGGNNFPLRGQKGQTWEGGIRVPMFWYWKNRLNSGTYEFPVSSLDLFPTIAQLSNSTIPHTKILDGDNIWRNIIENTETDTSRILYSLRHNNSSFQISAVKKNWKIHRFNIFRDWKLYDLSLDISESNDLYRKFESTGQKIISDLYEWCLNHYDPFWFVNEDEKQSWIDQNMPSFNLYFDLTDTLTSSKGPIPTFYTVDIMPPTKVETIKINELEFKIGWKNESIQQDGLIIEKKNNSIFKLDTILAPTTTQWVAAIDTSVSSQCFRLASFKSGVYSDYVTLCLDDQFRTPNPPSNLTTSGLSKDSVTIVWNDLSLIEDGYIIEMNQIHSFSIIGDIKSNSNSFTFSINNLSFPFDVMVYAYNNYGNSNPSNTLTLNKPELLEVKNFNPLGKIYPNPNYGEFTLELTNVVNPQDTLKIFDLSGKDASTFIISTDRDSEKILHVITSLSEGLYFLFFGKQMIGKIIIR